MSEFTDYVLDQLALAGVVRPRRMFGGSGVYVDGVFCAIITGSDRFFLRVGDGNRARRGRASRAAGRRASADAQGAGGARSEPKPSTA